MMAVRFARVKDVRRKEFADQMIEIKLCEVCGNSSLVPALNLGRHPLCDDLVPIGSDRECREYPIEILYCPECATAHQRFQVPKAELFPKSYHYRSRFTGDVLKGMESLVQSCQRRIGELSGKIVLDVGCNDGSLLDFFHAKGCKTLGIEPTDAWKDAAGKGHCIYGEYFSPLSAQSILQDHGSPDIITFTNVFAHIENLPELISALKTLSSPETLIVIENHYLGSVLNRHQFDTFYHEHPRTYSASSFLHIAKNLGSSLSSIEFPDRYGGNIRVFIGGKFHRQPQDDALLEKAIGNEADYIERFEKLQSNIVKWKHAMQETVAGLIAENGKLFGKAFPGRAAILIKLLELDDESIEAVFEKPGSMKIGHYLPGTRIPIKSDNDLFAMQDKPAILLNLSWHISDEIREYLGQNNFDGKVVDILSPEWFS